jgi:four helix bundle protein
MAEVIDFTTRTLRMPLFDMPVYKQCYALALELHAESLKFPAVEQSELADDLRRAVRAVCTHLIDGFEKQSRQSPGFYVEASILSYISLDVIRKIIFMIRFCRDLGYITAEQCVRWQEAYDHVASQVEEISEETMI